LENNGRVIISDGFEAEKVKKFEAEFGEHFEIEAKIDISYGVRNARYLAVER
jgi:hypothetical protein